MNTNTIVLGGGCFWCLEAVFQRVLGVQYVESGYSGGWLHHPTYEQVCGGHTGHAEVIKLMYDTKRVSLYKIFKIFFAIHDPTTLNYQGDDFGSQYCSVIYYSSCVQREIAEKVIHEITPAWNTKIVTKLERLNLYYKAEASHQDYFKRNALTSYCLNVIQPKFLALKKIDS